MRSKFGLAAAIAMASVAMIPVAATRDAGMFNFQHAPKKATRAAKRVRYAEAQAKRYRGRNQPPKRKLHRNMVRHGRRVRRKHRRAA